MEKKDKIINFKERKDEEMMYREEESKIEELVECFRNIEVPEVVDMRIRETCRKILEGSVGKD